MFHRRHVYGFSLISVELMSQRFHHTFQHTHTYSIERDYHLLSAQKTIDFFFRWLNVHVHAQVEGTKKQRRLISSIWLFVEKQSEKTAR